MEGRRRGRAAPLGLSCPLLTPRAAEFVGFEALLPWDGFSRAETQWLCPAETGEAGGVRAETTQSRTRLAWGHPALPLCQKKKEKQLGFSKPTVWLWGRKSSWVWDLYSPEGSPQPSALSFFTTSAHFFGVAETLTSGCSKHRDF